MIAPWDSVKLAEIMGVRAFNDAGHVWYREDDGVWREHDHRPLDPPLPWQRVG